MCEFVHVRVSAPGVAGGNRFLHVLRSRGRGSEYGGIPGVFTASLETRTPYRAVTECLCKVSERQKRDLV